MHFENNLLRTGRVNEAVRYIYMISNELDKNKKGQNGIATILSSQVGETGFEPATTWSQTRCATGLRYSPNFSVCTARVQAVLQFPAFITIAPLGYRFIVAVRAGFEPAVRGKTYDSLANYWIRPLSHLTIFVLITVLFSSPVTVTVFLMDCKDNCINDNSKSFLQFLLNACQLHLLLYFQQVLFVLYICIHQVFNRLAGVYYCCMVKATKMLPNVL